MPRLILQTDRKKLCLQVAFWTATLFGFAITASAQRVSYERPPIDYLNAEVNDRVAVLQRKLETGEASLEFDEQYGYLISLLKALEIPINSQSLVFSKTSLQLSKISPRRPRSLYFNDDVYVGYCQRGDVIEIAATDANQGATFYTLEQDQSARPRFVRDKGGCLSCHASSRTQGIPGYLVRSVFPDAAGRPKLGSGTFTTDHTSEFKDRWGGWYVTGSHGEMKHMGNTICMGDETTFDREPGANVPNLTEHFRTETYLTPHSDIVALMVLEHQTQMHNAIAAANYETRLALHQSFQMNELLERPEGFISDSAHRRIKAVVDDLLYYLLFCEEFQLTDKVTGTTDYATEFESQGKLDSQGRSLRQFDLQTRLFKHPCSYLIYSDAFAGLPEITRKQVLERLAAILGGREQADEYRHLTPMLRKTIDQILLDTLPEYATSHSEAVSQ
ncbi:hypothetical protein LOC67_11000 [Stieleria sp. JC731]|uniref:hypothetical protein n=1 Tax=Pirellulaceae TaxID=2691357 RepID=UPI001E2AF752|nr:hypothetical protein [Stieleria sp. JC731]MCC9601074.1 hypothetical protein [Stieleria sp. JC731]